MAALLALAPFTAKYLQRKTGQEYIVLLPVCWVVFEFVRTFFPFGGFPWADLSLSQSPFIHFIQFVDITGVYGLLFFIVWINQILSEFILHRFGMKQSFLKQKITLSIFFLVLVFGYGVYQVQTFASVTQGAPRLKVGLVQANIPQDKKWDEKFMVTNLFLHQEMSRQLFKANTDLVVWPEAAFPQMFPEAVSSFPPEVFGIPKTKDEAYLLFGALTTDDHQHLFNSAVLIDETGKKKAVYHKQHLVPFGEYIPLANVFPFLHKLSVPVGDFEEGSGRSVLPLSMGRFSVASLICFEGVFPQISRRQVDAGASLLVSLTNDAWYGPSSAPHQHLAHTVFRAVENKRSLVRAANTGFSAVVDPLGHILQKSPLFDQSLIVSDVSLIEAKTLYTKLGDWFPWSCVAYIAIAFLFSFIKRRGSGEKSVWV